MSIPWMISLEELNDMQLDRAKIKSMPSEDVTRILKGLKRRLPNLPALVKHDEEAIGEIPSGPAADILHDIVLFAAKLGQPIRA